MTTVTGFRISPQQAAHWQQEQSSDLGAVLQLSLHGPLEIASLTQRLRQLSSSEELLRTRLEALPGMTLPIQSIAEEADIVLEQEGLRGLSSEEQAQQFAAWRSLVDIQAPLSVIVAHTAEHRYVITLRSPACYADNESLRLIAQALLTETSATERLQYADYAEWKSRLLEDNPSHPGILYWRQPQRTEARSLTPGLERIKPTGKPHLAAQEVLLQSAHTEALLQLSLRLGCTREELFLAAWFVLLARLSDQTTLRIACIDLGRGEGLQSALGLYAQALPIQATVDLARPLSAQLIEILSGYRQAVVWRDYYDSKERLRYGFLFREALTLQTPYDVEVIYEGSAEQGYALSLECVYLSEELLFRLRYDREVLPDESVACLAEQWSLLLDGLLQEEEIAVGRIDLSGELQRRIVAPSGPLPKIEPVSILQLIARQAAQNPNALALTDGALSLSYDDLNRRANQLARALQQAGAKPGEVLGILLPRGIDAIVAILAALKASLAYLPLDPAYPAPRLKYMVNDSAAWRVVTSSAFAELLPSSAQAIYLDRIKPELSALADEDLPHDPAPEQLAYLIYTSGSTGQPKAVEITHQNLSHSTQVRMAYYETSVRAYLLLSSLSFDSSVAGIFWTLAQGGLLVLPASGDEMALTQLVKMIQEHRVSHGLSLPSLYEVLISFASPAQLESIETWIVAGEACKESVVANHLERLPRVRLVNEYGPTEATVWATAEQLDAKSTASGVSIGRPVPTMQLWLLNSAGTPAAIGEPGEIYLGGPSLARGYRGRPEQTAEVFVQHPNIPKQERAYRTGDRARWRMDGRLTFLGRQDHQVKIRGYRVELSEIERQLQTHEAVREAVVVAQESAGSTRLVAYLLATPDHHPKIETLRAHVEERLPGYMVPSAFAVLEAFPRTPNGKLDVQALPAPEEATTKTQYVAPRNNLESQLAQIYAEVLRLPRVGIFDNFFQIGGDSILSLQVVARANQRGIRFTAKQIFDRQTIAALSEIAEQPQTNTFSLDVHWHQDTKDRRALEAFALSSARYRTTPSEVCAALLFRILQPGKGALTLSLMQRSGEENAATQRYATSHQLQGDATTWPESLQAAKTAMRQIADSTDEAPDVALELIPLQDKESPSRSAREPLYLLASITEEQLSLRWAASQNHYSREQLRSLSEQLIEQFCDLAQHCGGAKDAHVSVLDFPSAGLDEAALADALAELAANNLE